MPKVLLEDKSVLALPLPAGKDKELYFDEKLDNFGLCVGKKERHFFIRIKSGAKYPRIKLDGFVPGRHKVADVRREATKKLIAAEEGRFNYQTRTERGTMSPQTPLHIYARHYIDLREDAGTRFSYDCLYPHIVGKPPRYCHLGLLPLAKIKPQDILDRMKELEQTTTPGQIRKSYQLLKWILTEAASEYPPLIEYVPTDFVDRLRKRQARLKGRSRKPRRLPIVLPQDYPRFLSLAERHAPDWFPLFHLMAMYGLSVGEALGLKKSDLDAEGGTLTVENALQEARRRGERPRLLGTKNAFRERKIKVFPETVELLKGHVGGQEGAKRRSPLIFSDVNGNPKRVNSLRKNTWYPLLDAMKEEGFDVRLPIKNLRHSAITFLLSTKKLTPREVADFVGHSDPQTTMRVYQQVYDEYGAAVVGAAGEALDAIKREWGEKAEREARSGLDRAVGPGYTFVPKGAFLEAVLLGMSKDDHPEKPAAWHARRLKEPGYRAAMLERVKGELAQAK